MQQQGMAIYDVRHLGNLEHRMAYRAADNKLRQRRLLDIPTSSASTLSTERR